MRPFRFGVRRWLGLALLIALLPAVLAAFALQYQSLQRQREDMLRADLELARAVATTFDAYVNDILHQELAIGLAVPALLERSPAEANRYLAANAAGSPAVRGFAWVSPTGEVLAASLTAAVGYNVGAESYLRSMSGGEPSVVSDLIWGQISTAPTFVVGRAIRDEQQVLRGFVLAAIDPTRLGEALGFRRVGGGTVAMLDRRGWVVYRQPTPHLSWEQRQDARSALGVEPPPFGQEFNGFASVPWQDGQMSLGLSPVPTIGWSAVAGRPVEEVLGPAEREAGRNLLLVLGVWSGALLVALVVARRITQPLKALRAHALALGAGDLHRRIELDGPRELRDLADALNRMAAELRTRDEEREHHLNAISHDLRTPLTAIIARLELMRLLHRQGGIDEREMRMVASIEVAAQRMNRMIQDLVDSARLSSQQLRLERAATSGSSSTPRPSCPWPGPTWSGSSACSRT